MPAGRDLDALVAEKVMGWDIHSKYTGKFNPGHDLECNYTTHESLVVRRVPEFSADISAALEVAIHLQKQGYYVCIDLKACEETSVGVYEENPAEQIAYAKAQTPSEAICKAALLAVMDRD
ncbi:hypothetical protein PACILC2_34680 [Paenibacillus cisolokensis]|uniref:Phage ABA sandwich domain-containing protein n=1 Tax=Paenibacillus cisolokensis TaxID=1658519 RepID=A0ABQ4N9P0_9BACL|nr:hypothetical protein [Paenibacillus cisolokensis]GIQ64900.1 hypothetical protein PACILC2_34680 [Paenibacillus cisolokensis]